MNIQDKNFSVIKLDLPTLLQSAAKIRDDMWGKEITYSRKVFIPLTNMCRDTCSYCTFVKHPSKPEARILTPEQVLFMAKQGEAHGCKEVLFSLGEKPELRYTEAKKKLAILGYNRMTSYLRDMCKLILEKTSLRRFLKVKCRENMVKYRMLVNPRALLLNTLNRLGWDR